MKIGKSVGQCGPQSNNQVHGSQADSDPVSGDQVSSREFNDTKSRLLIPPPMLQIDPSSETDEDEDIIASDNTNAAGGGGGAGTSSIEAVSNATKFIRNGNELRRSLRRINSLTRRKLSPSSIKDAISVQAKSPTTPTLKSPKKRKHSHGSIETGTGSAAAVTTVELQEPEFNSYSARLV